MSQAHVPAALRRLVHGRACGRCEYCLVPEAVSMAAHEVDHVVAQKHGGATDADNLALSCALCNKHKGSDLTSIDPETNDVVALFHPRRHRWGDHFEISGNRLIPLTPVGRVTARLLQFNQAHRVAERELLIAAGLLECPRE